MDVQVTRLQKVKNSCKVANTVVNIAFIITLVASILLFVLSIVFIADIKDVNDSIANSEVGNIVEQITNVEKFKIESSIPALQKYFDNHDYVYAYAVMAYIAVGLIIAVVTTVLMGLLKKIFKVILESDSPFDDQVIKNLRTVFIAVVVMIGLTVSVPIALIIGVIFVCVYNIFLYGKELQRLSDETL